MGGLIDSLFGGGAGRASDRSLDFIREVYGQNRDMAAPWAQGGLNSYNAYNAMLTGPGQEEAFQKWLDSSDYKFTTQQGLDAINHNMASKGLMNSGSTLKAITQWGQNNAQQYRNNYMNQLLGSAGLGANVLGNLMGASNQSAGMFGNQAMAGAEGRANGIGNFLNFGLGVAGLISDRRLKKDIKRIGKIDRGKGKGLPLYSYRYKGEEDGAQPHVGVMAQDVKKRVPEALGPRVGNYMSVDYRELANA